MKIFLILFLFAWALLPALAGPRAMAQRYRTEDYAICEYVLEADASGKTDATPALQGLIDRAAEAGGGVIWCPEGTYRFEGSLRLKKGVTLRGDWKSPLKTGKKVAGTVFAVYGGRGSEDGPSFITMEKVSGLVNLSVWYPEQDPENITPYPWTVSATDSSSCGYTLRNVNFVNSYKALSNGADDGMCYNVAFYSGIYGCPLKQGIYMHYVLDITRVEHLFFGPDFWSESGLPGAPASPREKTRLRNYLFENADAVTVGRFDWMPLYDADIDGYRTGLLFINNEFGCPNGNIYNVRIHDGQTALKVDAVSLYGWCISNSVLTVARRPGSCGVKLSRECRGGPLMFYGCTLGRVEAEKGSAAAFSFMECRFEQDVDLQGGDCAVYNCSGKGAAVINLPPGDNVVSSAGLGYYGNARTGTALTPLESLPVHGSVPFFRPSSEEVFDVSGFGAKGDEKHDDTAAFAAALAEAGKKGGTVYVPAGRYIISSPLTVPSGVELRGINEGPAHTMAPCSCIEIKCGLGSEDGAFVNLSGGSSLRGLCFWYPRARYDKKTVFPWTVRALGKNCQVRDVSLGNCWQGMDFASAKDTSGHVIAGVTGCCVRRGIFVDNAPRGGVVENCQLVVHYWDRNDSGLASEGPALTGLVPDVNNAMRRQSESFVFGDCRGERVLSTFSYASRKGLTLKGSFSGTIINHGSDGTVSGINIEENARALLVNTLAAPVPSMHLYGNGEYRPLDPENTLYVNKESRSIAVDKNFRGDVKFVNTSVWGYGDTLNISGSGKADFRLLATLLPLGTTENKNVSFAGAYSGFGTVWTAPFALDAGAFFGSFGILEQNGCFNAARKAAAYVSSSVSEGQGAEQLNDGLSASVYASLPEERTAVGMDFDEEYALACIALVNSGPDGSGYNTKDFDVYGKDGNGKKTLLASVRDNDRCVRTVPVYGRWRGIELDIITPGALDRHTRIGELLIFAKKR